MTDAAPTHPPSLEREDALAAMADEVVEIAGRPLDTWAVAALLESFGTRDVDARRLGKADVFALALEVEQRIARRDDLPTEVLSESPERALRWRRKRRTLARLYTRGIFFFVPLGFQLLMLLAFGYSQFTALNFTLAEATMVALAVSLSLLGTAGTVQALGVVGPMFDEPGKYLLTEKVVWRILGLGVLLAAAFGGTLFAIATAVGGWPRSELNTWIVYYALLSAMWLTNGVLYQQRRFRVILLATMVGLSVVTAVNELADTGIRQAHWWGLGATIALQLAIIAVRLRGRARATRGAMRLAQMPPLGLLVRQTAPWFFYGVLYFVFLQADRLVAWTWGDEPRPLWFHSDYEIAVDWALMAAVFGIGLLEQTLIRFSSTVNNLGEHFALGSREIHNGVTVRLVRRQLRSILLLLVLGGLVVTFGAVGLNAIQGLGAAGPLYEEPRVQRIFLAALIGYALMTLGLGTAAALTSLGRGWLAAMCMGAAAAAAVGGAIGGAALWGYPGSVAGIVAGGSTFLLTTAIATRRVLRRTDYYAYAAF